MLTKNNLQQFRTFTTKQQRIRYYLLTFCYRAKERFFTLKSLSCFSNQTLQAVMEYHNCFFYANNAEHAYAYDSSASARNTFT